MQNKSKIVNALTDTASPSKGVALWPAGSACTSIDDIISETERMVGETYHNPRPPAGAIILSLATQVYLLRKTLNHIESGAPSIVPEIPWRDYGNPRQG